MSKQYKEQLLHIATIGKTVGIRGDMKFHIKCDFPEQFYNGASFFTNLNKEITLSDVNLERGIIKISGVDVVEDAKKFTNVKLYTTRDETRKNCHLDKGEYFWFDILGCDVVENDTLLGKVTDIERVDVDYLVVQTDKELVNKGFPKRFLIDFKRHVKDVDIEQQKITASGAIDILESLK